MDLITPGILIITVAVFAQALFTLYLMLYAWEHPDRLKSTGGPEAMRPGRTSFTVLLPARHEESVIAETIRRVLQANYPKRLVEVLVVCSSDDTGTIEVARRTIKRMRTKRARVVTFDGGPINKPHGLNVGLAASRNDVVTIFDAEDDIDPEIFRIVNTVMLDEGVGIVQAGVQLVNHRDHWFSLLNCLEYFFWFKSRLHFHARVGMIPLGGNTVFMRRELIARVGGWDEECLTEDADIGVRLSALGERIRVVYDARHVTREETPTSVAELVRQRARWHQGFIQVLRKGDWLQIPGFWRKVLAFYTFTFPIIQVPLILLWPLAVIGGFWLELPIVVAMATFLPLYAVGFQMFANIIGAYMFAREFGFHVRPWAPLGIILAFIPYQFVLGWASARAVVRELHANGDWEKTGHTGAHRRIEPAVQRTAWRPMPAFAGLRGRIITVPLGALLRSAPAAMRRGVAAAHGELRAVAVGVTAMFEAASEVARHWRGNATLLPARVLPAPRQRAADVAPRIPLADVLRATIDHSEPRVTPGVHLVDVRSFSSAATTRSGCEHADAARGARYCRRCGAELDGQPTRAAQRDLKPRPAPAERSGQLPLRLSGHVARAVMSLVLALILSIGVPFLDAAPLVGRDRPAPSIDR